MKEGPLAGPGNRWESNRPGAKRWTAPLGGRLEETMIVARLYRSPGEVMDIHEFPISGLYGFDVSSNGRSQNQAWPEEFETLGEAITFARKYGWQNLNRETL